MNELMIWKFFQEFFVQPMPLSSFLLIEYFSWYKLFKNHITVQKSMVSTECVGVGLVQVKFYLWVITDHTAGYHLSGFTKLLNMQTNVINFTLRMLSKNVDRYSLSFLGKQSSIFKSLVTWIYHKVASKITRQCLKFPWSYRI